MENVYKSDTAGRSCRGVSVKCRGRTGKFSISDFVWRSGPVQLKVKRLSRTARTAVSSSQASRRPIHIRGPNLHKSHSG